MGTTARDVPHARRGRRARRNYRLVRQVRRVGERIDLPSGAESVTVEPLATAGLVRVTYLSPVRRLTVRSGRPTGGRPDRDDETPDYIN